MRTRTDSQDYYEDQFEINKAEKWLRSLRDQGHMDIGFLHLFMSVLVRTISQYPRLNRFVAGQRIYARNEILITLAIKKKLHEDGLETTLKIPFNASDTIFDIVSKVNEAIDSNKEEDKSNSTDNTARFFMIFPRWLIRFSLFALRTLDYLGFLPKAVHKASPFHSSAFITDLGSLGIKPIYHHIYNFGTTSLFIAFGGKEQKTEITENGKIIKHKYIPIKAVNDERICDGHYYATAFRYMRRLFRNPELLENPPDTVFKDIE